MERRVDVDADLPPVPIPPDVMHELFRHAVESLPEECCGLVVGDTARRYRRAVRCRNDMTARHRRDPARYPRDGRAAFYMNEHDYQKASEEARAAGQSVTAVYHSHVGAGAYLSPMDLEHAEHALFPFPEADQIVLPVYDAKVRDVGVFRRDAQGRFSGYPARVEP